MKEHDRIRAQLLKSAAARFAEGGYSTTTMARLAGDVGISPSYIYHFFGSKLDIAVELVEKIQSEALKKYADCAASKAKPSERIVEFFTESLRDTREAVTSAAHSFKFARAVWEHCPELHDRYLEEERGILSEFVQDGQRNGSFRKSGNADELVDAMQSAMTKFRTPSVWREDDNDHMERELKGVLAIILAGLSSNTVRQFIPRDDQNYDALQA